MNSDCTPSPAMVVNAITTVLFRASRPLVLDDLRTRLEKVLGMEVDDSGLTAFLNAMRQDHQILFIGAGDNRHYHLAPKK